MANVNHLLSVPCYNGTMISKDYYNVFLNQGNRKFSSVSSYEFKNKKLTADVLDQLNYQFLRRL